MRRAKPSEEMENKRKRLAKHSRYRMRADTGYSKGFSEDLSLFAYSDTSSKFLKKTSHERFVNGKKSGRIYLHVRKNRSQVEWPKKGVDLDAVFDQASQLFLDFLDGRKA